MNALEIIAQDLFDKVRSRFTNLQMGDESGSVTVTPTDARFFDFDFAVEGANLGRVSISINDIGNLKIFYSQGILENSDTIIHHMWYDFLKEMRFFAKRRLLRFDTRDITKGNLEKNDFQYLAQTGPKEGNMNESSMFGSSKTSHRKVEDTDLIIRHSEAIDPEKPGARSRKIKNLFIQNAEGERFKFPFIYLPGARAMQRHVANGGTPHDDAGKAIVKTCEDILQLKDFGKKVKYSSLNDNAHAIIEKATDKLKKLRHHCECLSKQGYYESWMSSFEPQGEPVTELDDATVEGYRDTFTQEKFDEALQDMFPLIHSIMQEAGEVDLEQYLVKESDIENIEDEVKEDSFDAFESWAESVVEGSLTPDVIAGLKDLMSQGIQLGADGTEVIQALQGIGVDDNELFDSLSQLAKMNPNADPSLLQSVIGSWLEKTDPQAAQEIAGAQPTANTAEQPPQEPTGPGAVQPEQPTESMTPSKNTDIADKKEKMDRLKDTKSGPLHNVGKGLKAFFKGEKEPMESGPYFGQEDFHQWLKDATERVAHGEVKDWPELYAELIGDLDMPPEKAERIAQRLMKHDTLAQYRKKASGEMDVPKDADGEDNDSSFLDKLRSQAKSGSIKQDTSGFGAEKEDSTDNEPEDDQEHLLEPGAGKSAKMKEVAKIVFGFFNRTDGTWTRGEHGVVTHVKRHFANDGKGGEEEAKLAAELIKTVNSKYQGHSPEAEMESIRKLAGLPVSEAKS
jgi:hypothetical protein